MGAPRVGKSTLALRVVTRLFVPTYTYTLENVFARTDGVVSAANVDVVATDGVATERDADVRSVSHDRFDETHAYDLYDVNGVAFAPRAESEEARQYVEIADAAVVMYDPYDLTSVDVAMRILATIKRRRGNSFPVCVMENWRSRDLAQRFGYRSLRFYTRYDDKYELDRSDDDDDSDNEGLAASSEGTVFFRSINAAATPIKYLDRALNRLVRVIARDDNGGGRRNDASVVVDDDDAPKQRVVGCCAFC